MKACEVAGFQLRLALSKVISSSDQVQKAYVRDHPAIRGRQVHETTRKAHLQGREGAKNDLVQNLTKRRWKEKLLLTRLRRVED